MDDSTITEIRKIARRWKNGEEPTDDEFTDVYNELPALIDLCASYRGMARRREEWLVADGFTVGNSLIGTPDGFLDDGDDHVVR